MKIPVVDMADCTRCAGCYDMYPELFELKDVGYVATVERECYPEEEVDDAIKHCPQDCISWEDI